MSYAMPFELLKNGKVITIHAWRTWLDPKTADDYKRSCIGALNDWKKVEKQEMGGTLRWSIVPVPDFDSIRFEYPPGNVVTVRIKAAGA